MDHVKLRAGKALTKVSTSNLSWSAVPSIPLVSRPIPNKEKRTQKWKKQPATLEEKSIVVHRTLYLPATLEKKPAVHRPAVFLPLNRRPADDETNQSGQTFTATNVADARSPSRSKAAATAAAAAAAAAVRKPFLHETPVSSGLLPALANNSEAIDPQKKARAKGTPKSKVRFPVGSMASNNKKLQLGSRARFLVKLAKKQVRPITIVAMDGVSKVQERSELIPLMRPIVVRMKPKHIKSKRQQQSRNSLPMLQLAMGAAKPNSVKRAFMKGSGLVLKSPWELTGSAAEREELRRLAEEEEAARLLNENWVAMQDYKAADETSMSCNKGDIFHSVQAAETEGWVRCTNKATGEVGELPAACLKKLVNMVVGPKFWKMAQDKIIAQIRREREIEKFHFEKWIANLRDAKRKHREDSEHADRVRMASDAAEREKMARAEEAAQLAAERAKQLRLDYAKNAIGKVKFLNKAISKDDKKQRGKPKVMLAPQEVAAKVAKVVEKRETKKKKKRRALPKSKSPEAAAAPLQPSQSAVMEYATETLGGGRSQFYKHIWCNKLEHDIDENITKLQLIDALKVVNSDLITETQIKFCLLALDTVSVASNNAPFDFRMFCVVAALSERVHAVESMMDGAMGALDFSDENTLQLKILKARKLFYLSEGAMASGCMPFDELEHVCLAGHIDMGMAEQLVVMVEDSGRTEVEFLDFLSYLPLFIQASSNIQSNPLGFERQQRLSRASGSTGSQRPEEVGSIGLKSWSFRSMVKKQQSLSKLSLVDQVGPQLEL